MGVFLQIGLHVYMFLSTWQIMFLPGAILVQAISPLFYKVRFFFDYTGHYNAIF